MRTNLYRHPEQMSTAIPMSMNKQISLDAKALKLNKNNDCKKILQCVSFKILNI